MDENLEFYYDDSELQPRADLPEFLKELYPEATEEEIANYIELIRSFDSDQLPSTKEAIRYKELNKQLTDLTNEKNKLRATLYKQFKNLYNHQIAGLKIIETESKSYSGAGFYDWVKSLVPEDLLESITVKTIDEVKFKDLVDREVIKYDSLPEDIYTKKEGFRIDIEGSRARKK